MLYYNYYPIQTQIILKELNMYIFFLSKREFIGREIKLIENLF